MRWTVFLVTVAALTLGVPRHGSAVDYDTAWVRTYQTRYAANASRVIVRSDDEGNVVMGTTVWNDTTWDDILVVKYDPAGQVMWSARFAPVDGGSDDLVAMELDMSGNVILTGFSDPTRTGYSGFDYVVVKFDRDGSMLWSRYFGGQDESYDAPADLVVDATGNVYVTGSLRVVSGSPPWTQWGTLKYDPSGTLLWSRTFSSPIPRYNEAQALTVDGDGSVYVFGDYMNEDYSAHVALVKYSGAGDFLWAVHDSSAFRACDVEITPDGGVVVVGTGFSTGQQEIVVRKIALSGASLWSRSHTWGDPLNDGSFPTDVEVDGLGRVYVAAGTGYYWWQLGVMPHYAIVTFDFDGTKLWDIEYCADMCSQEAPVDLALGPTGVAFVTGPHWDSGSFASTALLLGYTMSGVLGVEERFGDLPISEAIGHTIAFGDAGTVYLGARQYLGGGQELVTTIRFDPCDCPCHADPACDAITDVFDVLGAVAVAFQNGDPVFDTQCPKERTDVTCDGFTDVFDVLAFVSVAFQDGNPALAFCDACAL